MKNGFIKVAAATPAGIVADPVYNAEQIQRLIEQAEEAGVKMIVFPELCITAYTCGDLFLQETLLQGAKDALLQLVENNAERNMVVAVGLPLVHRNKLYNCAVVFCAGQILGVVPKTHIPGYGEFAEGRHFQAAPEENGRILLGDRMVPFGSRLLFQAVQMPEMVLAVEICEDLLVADPCSVRHAAAGASLIANLSASNETVGKAKRRRELIAGQSARLHCGYVYANAGEGESTTDLIFAGHNLIGENGKILAESELFTDGLLISEIDIAKLSYERRRINTVLQKEDESYEVIPFSLPQEKTVLTRKIDPMPFVPEDSEERKERCRTILAMQVSGLKKRIMHTHCQTLVLGISGGLDSTLALLVAVEAADRLGRDRKDIIAVTMPCFGTTQRTKGNAERMCQQLGVELRCVDIKRAVTVHFEDIGHDPAKTDVTYENGQARERTQVLMDIANDHGGMVVGTGDLSELALGWATYNGDHMSMYGVNGSLPKTLIRHMVRTYSEDTKDAVLAGVLQDILDTPVSPELLPARDGEITQKTEDIVGPYELHDFILYQVVRYTFPPDKVYRLACRAFAGIYDGSTILYWMRTFYRRFFQQQFKRSCLPDGPKVGSVALSPRGDWQMPSDASAALWLAEVEKLGTKE